MVLLHGASANHDTLKPKLNSTVSIGPYEHCTFILLASLPSTSRLMWNIFKGWSTIPIFSPTMLWTGGLQQSCCHFQVGSFPGKNHEGPDGLSRRKPAEWDVDEGEDGWVDEVLGLGVWVNSWIGWSGYKNGLVDEDYMGTAHTSTLLMFSFSSIQKGLQNEMPRTKDDIRMDNQLPLILSFLSRAQELLGLDRKATKQFIQRALHFFVKDDKLWQKDTSGMHWLVILDLRKCLSLILQAHDQLGHKQVLSTWRHLSDCFWWPGLDRNVAWFWKTCHECQLQNTQHVFIPPTVATHAPLFQHAHFDTMHMPHHSGLQYIIQARCSLTLYAKFKMLVQENRQAIGKFIFQEILCHWGTIAEIITDNRTPIIAALDWLSEKYHINHIWISAYNKQANSLVERSHPSICESMVKACNGDISCCPEVTLYLFWADRVTVRWDLGFSPFYMAHGTHPILPFNVTEATFLVPKLDSPLSTQDLIAICAQQLQKWLEHLEWIKVRVLKVQYASIAQFKKDYANIIVDYEFQEGASVLIRNSSIKTDLSRKTKPCYLGPLVVIHHSRTSICFVRTQQCYSQKPLCCFPSNPLLSSFLDPHSHHFHCHSSQIGSLRLDVSGSLSEEQVDWGQSNF